MSPEIRTAILLIALAIVLIVEGRPALRWLASREWLVQPDPNDRLGSLTCTQCGGRLRDVTAEIHEHGTVWLCHGTDRRPCCTMNQLPLR